MNLPEKTTNHVVNVFLYKSRAEELNIANQHDYNIAIDSLKAVKDQMKIITAWFKTIKQPAKAAYDKIIDEEKRTLEPLKQADEILNAKVNHFLDEQARQQRLAEERARAEAKRTEDEQRLKRAQIAEEAGDKELAETILNEPNKPVVAVATPILKKTAGVTRRQNWKYKIVDANKIPREYLMPDEKKIAGIVRAMKKNTNIPGIEPYDAGTIVVRS